jgi:mannose-1-phosphate guanylyltransferase/phosphomannomutase
MMRTILLATDARALARIDGEMLLVHELRWLRDHGLRDFIVTVAGAERALRAEVDAAAGPALRVSWLEEPTPLGSAGALRPLRELLEHPFLVVDAAMLHDFDLRALIRAHESAPGVASIAVRSAPEAAGPADAGRLWYELDRSDRVLRALTHRDRGIVWADAGAAIVDPVLIDHLPERTPIDLGRDLFPLVLRRHAILSGHRIHGDVHAGGSAEAAAVVQRRQRRAVSDSV